MIKIIMLLIIVLVAASSCMDTVNRVENADRQANPNFVKNKRSITDSFLSGRLTVVRVDKQQLSNDLLKIQVTLRSERVGFWDWIFKGDEPYKISYRFTWMNAHGMMVNTPTDTWLEKDVLPGELTVLQAIGPNPSCKDFNLQIREL